MADDGWVLLLLEFLGSLLGFHNKPADLQPTWTGRTVATGHLTPPPLPWGPAALDSHREPWKGSSANP